MTDTTEERTETAVHPDLSIAMTRYTVNARDLTRARATSADTLWRGFERAKSQLLDELNRLGVDRASTLEVTIEVRCFTEERRD